MAQYKQYTLEGVTLPFGKNFSGEEGKFNAKGDRNFCISLTKDQADFLSGEGLSVHSLPPKDEDSQELYYLPIKVSYKVRPPEIYMVTSSGKRKVSENNVSNLDYADIISADVTFTGRPWEMNGKHGVKAYLNNLYATIQESPLEEKYADIPDFPDSATNTMTFAAISQ